MTTDDVKLPAVTDRFAQQAARLERVRDDIEAAERRAEGIAKACEALEVERMKVQHFFPGVVEQDRPGKDWYLIPLAQHLRELWQRQSALEQEQCKTLEEASEGAAAQVECQVRAQQKMPERVADALEVTVTRDVTFFGWRLFAMRDKDCMTVAQLLGRSLPEIARVTAVQSQENERRLDEQGKSVTEFSARLKKITDGLNVV